MSIYPCRLLFDLYCRDLFVLSLTFFFFFFFFVWLNYSLSIFLRTLEYKFNQTLGKLL
ncbi:hypothetical protein PanWU01x14_306110 [Parasponia andersonii]|uniref:Transmembrane protein n=1 Tax=Parasponia andersonii TaxID=3476 RepID=A0A2P5ARV9_PARAD|nr:hypothetical protein PanWU01x14_306110 [Parasponia andersonii]